MGTVMQLSVSFPPESVGRPRMDTPRPLATSFVAKGRGVETQGHTILPLSRAWLWNCAQAGLRYAYLAFRVKPNSPAPLAGNRLRLHPTTHL